MSRCSLLIFVGATLISTSGDAQDYSIHPQTLVGFLKPGTNVGLRTYIQGDVKVTIYTEEEFRIAKDARSMTLDELSRKHSSVETRTKAALEAHNSVVKNGDGRMPRVRIHHDRQSLLCTIAYVGKDYILVSYGTNGNKKRAFASRSIKSVHWAPAFTTSVVSMKSKPRSQ